MNKNIFIIAITSLTALAACGDHDAAYYQEHPEKAKEKLDDCKQRIGKAFMAQDKEAMKDVKADQECRAARDALSAIRKQEAEQAALKRKAEEEAVQAKVEKAFNQEYGNLSWQEYITAYAKSNCANATLFAYDKLNEQAVKCAVMQAHYEQTVAEGIKELIKQPFDELRKARNTYCQLDARRISVCSVWEKAVAESAQQKFNNMDYVAMAEQKSNYCDNADRIVCNSFNRVLDEKRGLAVQHFSENDDDYKREYNKCYEKGQKIKNPGIFGGGYRIAQDDPLCSAVNAATKRRNLRDAVDFKKPF